MPTAVIVTRIYEPEGAAAAYRLGNLVRAFARAGYGATVLTSRSPGGPPSSRQVRRWPVLRDSSGSVRGYLQYLSFDIPAFFRLLFGPRADIVVVEPPPTTGLAARVACWLRRTPYVYYSADVLSSAVEGIGASKAVVAVVRWLERRSLRGATLVLAVSDEVRDEVVNLGAHPDRVVVVGTGIDTEQFSASGDVITSETPYFVYAGTMSEVHGAGVFLDAFTTVRAQWPDVRVRFFGAGVELEALRERAKALGDSVEFLGLVDATELTPWIRGAVASLASVRPDRGYDFAYATKALASLSCGTPVIYAGVGPMASLISDHGLGWATPWDASAVAEAMNSSLKAAAHRREHLAAWVERHHSMRAVADRAVVAINSARSAPRGPASLN
jgi:glycosyltransferase involved in cell wall biosynthesis